MLLLVSFSEWVHVMWFIALLCSVSGNEDKNKTSSDLMDMLMNELNKKQEFVEFCKSANLWIMDNTHSKKNTVTISFELSDPVYRGCYEYYDITLQKGKKMVDFGKVKYVYSTEKSASYVFENVTCGIYGVTIQPCYNSWQCAPIIIRYSKLINMTSNDCIAVDQSYRSAPPNWVDKRIVIITAFSSAFFILGISGLIYYFYWSVELKQSKKKNIAYKDRIAQFNGDEVMSSTNDVDIESDKIAPGSIKVYILHYYDSSEVNKRKTLILKDFLLNLSYFHDVRSIEDELAALLFDVNNGLNNMLEERGQDGTIRKIILIASDEEYKENQFEMENLIFSEFLSKMNDNLEKCLTGYDHLFVVQLDDSLNYSMKFKDIVKRVRYSLSEELIEDHLLNLCLNLCSGSNLDLIEVENNVKDLLSKHLIRHLGNLT